jgi:hypothetical protein
MNNGWNPVAEEKFWRETLKDHRACLEPIEQKFGGSGFYLALLSELDAAAHFTKPEYFVSRSVFVAELRRLMTNPLPPSRHVPNVEDYRRVQKTMLESTIKKYETDSYML